uniref:Uncharacterized protein n=1 Tax=Arundo donax TaxID=35708 RepID=A0A0A9CHH0_ARUDO
MPVSCRQHRCISPLPLWSSLWNFGPAHTGRGRGVVRVRRGLLSSAVHGASVRSAAASPPFTFHSAPLRLPPSPWRWPMEGGRRWCC